jgi:nucleoside-diphosphate-sugar epimerase
MRIRFPNTALSVGRSFQYVSDLVNGLVSLMNSNYTLPVNIGNPDEHTISTFAHLIRFAFHFNSHTPPPPHTPNLCGQLTKASLSCQRRKEREK